MSAAVKIDSDALDKILKVDAAPLVAQVADRVANSAAQLAGTVDGSAVRTIRDDGVTPTRARSAVIAVHPTDNGRKAARDALARAVMISGG